MELTTVAFLEDEDPDSLVQICAITNAAYDLAETGLWMSVDSRANLDDIRALVRKRRLLVCTENRRVVGSIQIEVKEREAWIGMLSTSPERQGAGIGSRLMLGAEAHARRSGCRRLVGEVLYPVTGTSAPKDFLLQWYSRLGFATISRKPFAAMYPEKAAQLRIPCDLIGIQKVLD